MLEQLAERYRQMPDERLLQIALEETSGLTPEALATLRAEISARGIDPAVERAIEAQTKSFSRRDVELLVEAVRKQPCPERSKNIRPLNGGFIAEVKSVLILTTFEKHTVIACPDCLATRAKRAALASAGFGWWSFPMGPVRTVQALIANMRTMRQGERDDASDALYQWVEKNPGVATAFAEKKVYNKQ